MAKLTWQFEDADSDGIDDYIAVYSNDYHEPLIGDYRGIELCRIHFIPTRYDSIQRAAEIADCVISALYKASTQSTSSTVPNGEQL